MINIKIKLSIFSTGKDGKALYGQEKQDWTRALLAPLHLAGGTPSVWAEAAALQQQHYFSFSFSFCSFVHLNVYLELHFVKNLPLLFLFPS